MSGPVSAAEASLDRYRSRLRELAERCERDSMPLEAQITRSRLWEDPPYGLTIPKLPNSPLPSLPTDATPEQKAWFEELRTIQREESALFWEQAQREAQNRHGYEAFWAAERALILDPDNERLRAVFGFTLYENRWRTAWEIQRLKKGLIDHPQFGWIEKEAAEKKPPTRKKSGRLQKIETEHFELRTTLSLEEGVRLARFLEEVHECWFYLFFQAALSERDASAAILTARAPKLPNHRVVAYANRQEYLDAILKHDGDAEVSSGGYISQTDTVFLYRPDLERPEDTPLDVMAAHEAVHQLFAESALVRKIAPGRRELLAGTTSNYWALEGIAVYFETLRVQAGARTLGGLASYRFVRAKERVGEPNGLIPLSLYTALNQEDFKSHENLPALYTEAAGLTHFLMHGEGNKYRDAFFRLLWLVYGNQERPEELSILTGKDFDSLDREFHDYLQNTSFRED